MAYVLKCSCVVFLLLFGCSGDAVQWAEWPVAPEAENVQKYELKNEKARQTSYTVNAQYPSKAVAEFYSKQIKKPWVRCYQEIEWQSFGDATQTPPAFIHQMLLHWANYETNHLLVLGVRYVSAGTAYRKTPVNEIQNVHLVEYQEMNLEEVVSRLGLSCDRT